MREIRTSGSMSGEGKRNGDPAATAPLLDSTQQKKWDEMQAKREQWGQGHRHGPPDGGDQPGPPPQQ